MTLTQFRTIKNGQPFEMQKIVCFDNGRTINSVAGFKSCSMTALFDVKKKDSFVLQNFGSDSRLNLREGTNFFGATVLK